MSYRTSSTDCKLQPTTHNPQEPARTRSSTTTRAPCIFASHPSVAQHARRNLPTNSAQTGWQRTSSSRSAYLTNKIIQAYTTPNVSLAHLNSHKTSISTLHHHQPPHPAYQSTHPPHQYPETPHAATNFRSQHFLDASSTEEKSVL